MVYSSDRCRRGILGESRSTEVPCSEIDEGDEWTNNNETRYKMNRNDRIEMLMLMLKDNK